MILYTIAYLDRQVINLLVDDIRTDLHATDVQMSLLQGVAFVASFSLCGLAMGWAIDRYPRRWIVFLGVMIWSTAATAAGLSRSFTQLFTARLGVGAGEAALNPAAYSTLAQIFPKDRLSVPIAVFTCGASIGAGLSLIFGGLIVGWAHAYGTVVVPLIGLLKPWQLTLMITGAPGFALAFLVFVITEPMRPALASKADSSQITVWQQFRRHPTFYASHFIAFSFLNMLAQGWNNWSPTYFARAMHWSIPRVGATIGTLGIVGGVAGQLSGAAIADFMFRRGIYDAHLRIYIAVGLALAILGVTLSAAVASSNLGLISICVLLIYVGISFLAVASSALQIATPAHLRGRISTIFLLVYNVTGYGLGPLAVALMTQHVFKDPALVGSAITCDFLIFGVLTAVTLGCGLKASRRAVREARMSDAATFRLIEKPI